MAEVRNIKIDTPAIVLVMPYEGRPWGVFTPNESAIPQVLDWVARAYPQFMELIEQYVEAARMEN